jgi:hypothetical protein
MADINLETFDEQLNSSEWVCPALSDHVKNQITNDLTAIDKDLDDINKILIQLSNDKTGPGIDIAR